MTHLGSCFLEPCPPSGLSSSYSTSIDCGFGSVHGALVRHLLRHCRFGFLFGGFVSAFFFFFHHPYSFSSLGFFFYCEGAWCLWVGIRVGCAFTRLLGYYRSRGAWRCSRLAGLLGGSMFLPSPRTLEGKPTFGSALALCCCVAENGLQGEANLVGMGGLGRSTTVWKMPCVDLEGDDRSTE
ncbi:hypothetical protein VTK26DRAFT_7150 [Humicola hyalothermophila]